MRKGNPKGVKDWDDLIKPGITSVAPNPKTSGGARWAYLAAWGYALQKNGGDAGKARAFVTELLQERPRAGPRARAGRRRPSRSGAIGDVLVSWENEAYLLVDELGKDKFQIVNPSVSILAEPPVAIVDKNVDKARHARGPPRRTCGSSTRPKGQELAAKNHYPPRATPRDRQEARGRLPQDQAVHDFDQVFGGWQKAQATHFADDGVFDQIFTAGK